jgi:hypothetical protein
MEEAQKGSICKINSDALALRIHYWKKKNINSMKASVNWTGAFHSGPETITLPSL